MFLSFVVLFIKNRIFGHSPLQPEAVGYLKVLSSTTFSRSIWKEVTRLAGSVNSQIVTYAGREKGFAVLDASGVNQEVLSKVEKIFTKKYGFDPVRVVGFNFSFWIDEMVMPKILEFLESGDFTTSCLAIRTWLGTKKIRSFADFAQYFADLKKIALARKISLPAEIVEENFDFYDPASIIEKLKRLDAYIYDQENDTHLVRAFERLRNTFHIPQGVNLNSAASIRTWIEEQPQETFDNVTEINLNSLGLTMIPYEVTKILEKCRNLQVLGLSNNRLTAIPDGFLHPNTALQVLGLSNNLLTTIPDGFLHPNIALQVLELSSNRLTAIPDGFLHPNTALQRLYLSNNCLTAIPDDFLHPNIALQVLELSSNRLTAIPDNFLHPNIALQRLFLSGNHIIAIPPDFLNANTALQELHLSHNRIIAIPDGFLHTNIALQELHLSCNQLTEIPSGLLQNNHVPLSFFSISGNPIRIYPALAFLARLDREQKTEVISLLPLRIRIRKECAPYCSKTALFTGAIAAMASVAAYAGRT